MWEAVIYDRACSLTTDRLAFDRNENHSGEPFRYGKARYSKAWFTPVPRSKGYQAKQESIHRASIHNTYHHLQRQARVHSSLYTTKTWMTMAMQKKDFPETDDIRWNTALEHWLYGLILNGFGQNNLRKSGPHFMNTSACLCPLDSKFLFWVPLAEQQQCYPSRSSLPIYMAVTLSRDTQRESLVHSQPEAQFLPTVSP